MADEDGGEDGDAEEELADLAGVATALRREGRQVCCVHVTSR